MRMRRIPDMTLLAAAAFAAILALAACQGRKTSPPPPPPPTITPAAVLVFPGSVNIPVSGTAQFSAFLPSNSSATFNWSVSGGASNGSISAGGLYTAPATVPSPASVTITATDSASSSVTGTATVNITAAPGVAVSPAAIAVPAGTTQVFSATVGGNPVAPTWQVNGVTGGDSVHGTITANGTYTAPATPPLGGSATITAISGANSGTATVVVVFSKWSLSGRYAFSYSGKDSSGVLAVAGSFNATPSTTALSGVEDYNSKKLTSPSQAGAISGSYSVNPDGTGSATINNSTIGAAETWQFTLTTNPGSSAGHALLIRFDSSGTASGTLDQQNSAQLGAASFDGNYVFALSGLDGSGKPLQIAGKLFADGINTIPLNDAVEDINDNGTNTGTSPDKSLHGDYLMDAAHPLSGRGTLNLRSTNAQFPSGQVTLAFYLVNSTHLKVVETDTNAFLSGELFSAPNTNGSFSSSILKGNYAFVLGGTDVQNSLPYTAGGVFAANGSGGITSGVLDTNDGGATINLDQTLTASSYSVDASLGRIGSLTLVVGSTTYNFAGYAASNGSVLFIELDSNIVGEGLALSQSATSAPLGSFALNFTGAANSSGNFATQDAVGQIVAVSGGVSAGSLDVNNAGTVTSGAAFVSGTTIGTPSSGRGTATFKTQSFTFPVAYYTVDGNAVLILETDRPRVLTGVFEKQF